MTIPEKLCFYDTGLCCSLLRIEKVSQLNNHYLKGALFENLILSEFLKRCYNQGKVSNLYFWKIIAGWRSILSLSTQMVLLLLKSNQPKPGTVIFS